eukprot:3910983-Pyramimonas_sp.AAC.1
MQSKLFVEPGAPAEVAHRQVHIAHEPCHEYIHLEYTDNGRVLAVVGRWSQEFNSRVQCNGLETEFLVENNVECALLDVGIPFMYGIVQYWAALQRPGGSGKELTRGSA